MNHMLINLLFLIKMDIFNPIILLNRNSLVSQKLLLILILILFQILQISILPYELLFLIRQCLTIFYFHQLTRLYQIYLLYQLFYLILSGRILIMCQSPNKSGRNIHKFHNLLNLKLIKHLKELLLFSFFFFFFFFFIIYYYFYFFFLLFFLIVFID